MGCLAYLSYSQGSVKVLNWWMDLCTASQIRHLDLYSNVGVVCLHITINPAHNFVFRARMKAQNLLNSTLLPVKGFLQPYSAWYLLGWSPIIFFFSSYNISLPGAFDAATFVFAYGSIFIFLAIFMVSKTYERIVNGARLKWKPAEDHDFVLGIDQIELLTRASEAKRASK